MLQLHLIYLTFLLFNINNVLAEDAPIKLINATGTDEEPVEIYELPRTVQVQKYLLDFEPFPLFSGFNYKEIEHSFLANVKIQFKVIKQTSTVWLNSEGLRISNLSLSILEDDVQKPVKLTDSNFLQNNFIVLKAENSFNAGQIYLLTIYYSGDFSSVDEKGIFSEAYKNANGTITRPFISTWFQPAYSRRLFPNFEDPYLKATFNVKVRTPKEAGVYSNQEIESVDELNDYQKLVTFKTTPRMPSYLLTVLIGDLRHKNVSSKNGVSIRAISIPEAEPYLDGPANILRNCFDATQAMFDLKYPMKKLDAFIDPVYHGALEDFGLIKLEEDVLQLPESLPSVEKFYSNNLICHETAHIYFGNILTNDKWTDVWLHESFANYVSFRNMLSFVNETNYVEAEFIKTKQIGLTAMLNRTLSMPIAQNNQKFNDITYDAGANVLRMLEAIIGVKEFQKILNTFTKRFAYRNVKYSDFVALVEKEFNSVNSTSLCGELTIREVMDDYLTQTSIPIISVDITNKGKFKLVQNQQTNKWNVPLFLNDQQIVWLLKNGSVCSSKSLKFDQQELLMFNYKSYSFANFEYSLAYWERLIDADLTKIDELTLLGLIQDLEHQIKQKKLHQRNRFKRHAKKNKKKLRKLKAMMQILIAQIFRQFDGNVLPQFIEYLEYLDAPTQRALISLAYPHVTWSNASSWREGHFSSEILHLAVQFDVGDARTQAKNLFLQFVQSCKSFKQLERCNRVDANARKAVYSVASYIKQTKFLKAYRKALEDSVEPYFYFRQELRNIEDALY